MPYEMADNDIEDVQFLPGPSSGKRAVYEPHSLQKCKQMICSPGRATLLVAVTLAAVFCVALIASLARPPAVCPDGGNNHGPTTESPVTFPWNNIRLPDNIIPLKYRIYMHPNLTTFQFEGSVNITFSTTKDTNFLVIHSANLTHDFQLFEWDPATEEIVQDVGISEIQDIVKYQQVYLDTFITLTTAKQYLLRVDFTGALSDDLAGFYKSSYTPRKDDEDNKDNKRWLATTHFESSSARKAFPCFDEPQLKATFQLSIVRNAQHMSLFNTKLEETKASSSPGLLEDVYKESVVMSTYLVAFLVSDFIQSPAAPAGNTEVSVYTPPHLVDEAWLALDVAPKILSHYEDYYGVNYPLEKCDHVAIPDFGAGAMENWGLIMYRVKALLVNKEISSAREQQTVVLVIAHELAHQWFGNIVTMLWWNDLWLNEGFANFMEYKGIDSVRPDWKLPDQFLVETLFPALYEDGLRSSHPISVEVTDPAEIEEIFDGISYGKGASIIRMLEDFLSPEVFRQGLQMYLQEHKFSNAKTDDLWESLSKATTAADVDLSGMSVKDIMDTWTQQMSYPVVTVTRNGNKIAVTQERFLFNKNGQTKDQYTSPYGYKWKIFLSYISDVSADKKTQWMQDSVDIDLDPGTTWIKMNVGGTGMYRVHYDEELWDALIQQLNSDHMVFTPADRATLIQDAFSLVRSSHLSITKALTLSQYLSKETDYVPWATAIGVLSYINQLTEGTSAYSQMKTYMLSLMQPLLLKNQWEKKEDHLDQFLQTWLLHQAVRLEDKDTKDTCLDHYSNWKNQEAYSLNPNLKSLVFECGARFGGDQEWEYLLELYENPQTDVLEKKNYLYSLTYTSDVLKLTRLLDMSLDQNKIRSADAVYVIQRVAYNPAGSVLAWNFVQKRWDDLFSTYKNLAFQMKHLIEVPKLFSTTYDYKQVTDFFSSRLQHQDQRSVSQMLENIEMNIDWLERNYEKLADWLTITNNDSS